MPGLSEKLALAVLPALGRGLLRLLRLTLSFEVVNFPELAGGERAIFSFWHGRMLMMPFFRPEGPMTVMVSRHRDGEFISRTVKGLGIESFRGSTTRGGATALKESIRLARRGYHLSFTPDGPKGPRYRVQMGVVQAAMATGLPIYPVTYSTRKKKH
jgi:lysophospholipid acyltransferase (LPLAT)-like uncharacterized protein